MIELVKEKTPGLRQARDVEAKLHKHGIHDVKLFFDPGVTPKGLWGVYQVRRQTKRVILPEHYDVDGIEPYRIYVLKDNEGVPRLPDNREVENMRIIVHNAHRVWKASEGDADVIEKAVARREREKNEAHKAKQRARIHAIAPELQKAIRKELG